MALARDADVAQLKPDDRLVASLSREVEAAAASAAASLAASRELWQQRQGPKNFASSNFLVAYSQSHSKPKRQSQLMESVHALITAHAAARGVPTPRVDAFFETLQHNAFTTGGLSEVLSPKELMHIATRLWTSAELLDEQEFCSIINATIRSDDNDEATIGPLAMITHAINSHCVTRRTAGISGTVRPSRTADRPPDL